MIRLERAGRRWTVTLDRPERANALTRAMLEELAGIAAEAEAAARAGELAALVLTGAGERVFSAGADLDEVRAGRLGADPAWERLSGRLAALPCLTICALNGTLAGGAFGMALACDTRISVPEARFFYPVMRLGYLPQPSDPARLVALVGPARASRILLAAERIDAPTALAWGLIDAIHPREELGAAIDALAEPAEQGDAAVLGRIKAMIAAAAGRRPAD